MMISKVRNNKGITMLYALLGILIFAMVGIVIFNASTANYARFKREQKIQQSYLSVSSAADVFIDSIAGDKVTYKVVENVEGLTWNYVDYGNESPISDTLKNMVIDCYESKVISPKKYTINATLDDKQLEEVNVTLKMIDYDLIVEFTNGKADSDVQYYLTATIPFVTDDKTSKKPVLEEMYYDITNVKNEVYKVEWDTGNISIERGTINE